MAERSTTFGRLIEAVDVELTSLRLSAPEISVITRAGPPHAAMPANSTFSALPPFA